MIDLLVELAGFVLVAAFLVLAFGTWGVLAAGGLLIVVGNLRSVPSLRRGERR